MSDDENVAKTMWIDAMERGPIAALLADGRFPDAQKLAERFNASISQWRKDGNVRPAINDANEILAAVAILRNTGPKAQLLYEPKLSATSKTIDFRLDYDGELFSWYDVKTIAPNWQDDDASWKRFEKIAQDFPPNAQLIVDRGMGGAALSGQEFKARWSLIRRTVETEEKASLLTIAERAPVSLLICADGASFGRQAVGFFAHYYDHGTFKGEDWARHAIERHLKDEGISLRRNLSGFAYMERLQDETDYRHFLRHDRVNSPTAT